MGEALILEPDVVRAASGDRQAFGRLIDATRTTVCSIALAVVRDVETSEDVAQDVYLHAWRGLPTLRNAASFLPWLRQMTRNRANFLVRQAKPWKKTRLDETLEAVLVDHGPGPEARVLEEAERQSICDALDELTTDHREVLILFYREEQSVRQVGNLLELSEAAVKKRLERARQAMKQALDHGLAEALERTKPGAAFSFTVLGMLPLLAPTAAAASKGLLGFVGSSKAAASVGSSVAGASVGVLGLLIGYFYLAKDAVDARERRQIWLLAAGGVAAVGAVFAGSGYAYGAESSLGARIVWHLVLIGVLALQQFVFLPRIMARRFAAEVAADPDAAVRHVRQKRAWAVAFWVMAVIGVTPLVWTLVGTP